MKFKHLDPEMWIAVFVLIGFGMIMGSLYLYQLYLRSGIPVTNVNF